MQNVILYSLLMQQLCSKIKDIYIMVEAKSSNSDTIVVYKAFPPSHIRRDKCSEGKMLLNTFLLHFVSFAYMLTMLCCAC